MTSISNITQPLFIKEDKLEQNRNDLESIDPQIEEHEELLRNFYLRNVFESWLLFYESIPNIFSGVFLFLNVSITVYYAGKSSDIDVLAAIGFCSFWIQLFGIGPIYSCNIGFLSLSSQAYGEGDLRKVGILYQRALLANFIIFCLMAAILALTPFAFNLIGFNQVMIDTATPFLLINIPASFFMIFSDTTKIYLMTHGIFTLYTTINMITTIVFAILCYFSYNILDYGMFGIGLSRSIVEALNVILVIGYIKRKKICQKSWIPWTWYATRNLQLYFFTVLPSALTVYLENSLNETIGMLSSLLGKEVIAVVTILLQITNIFAMIYTGLANTVVTYISKAIGGGDLEKTKYYLKMNICCYINYLLVSQIFIFFCFDSIVSIFTEDLELLSILKQFKLVFSFFLGVDGLPFVYCSNLRGLGLHGILFQYFLKSYYFIGLISIVVLGLILNLKVAGFLFGLNLGELCFVYFTAIILRRVDMTERHTSIKEELSFHVSPIVELD